MLSIGQRTVYLAHKMVMSFDDILLEKPGRCQDLYEV